jgi:thiosulfate/3-mercaptopyruvate sulfurtransferase
MSTITKFESPLVSAEWLNTNSNATNLIVLDATINKVIDTSSSRIPNARFFDIKNKFSDCNAPFPSTLPTEEQFQIEARALGICNDSVIVVYDDKGLYSSARCWWLFKVFGFDAVAVLDGGLPEWQLQNFNVESYKEQSLSLGDFKAKFRSNLMTDFKGVNQFRKEKDAIIIDARSKARFNCEVDEPRAGLRRGTILNSVNLPYTELFNENLMKPKSELLLIFNTVVKEKKKLVFSCGSGITACILALAATICNYKQRVVYDGSWTEYGTLKEV